MWGQMDSRGQYYGHIQPYRHIGKETEPLERADLSQDEADEGEDELGNDDWSWMISTSLAIVEYRSDECGLTTQESITVTANSHLCQALTIGHDAQRNAEEELEALQEVGQDTSPVPKEAESDITLQTDMCQSCM